jgi:MoxR-like ATPase
LYRAAQAMALAEGRDYAIPDDVKQLAVPVFAHRLVVDTRNVLGPRRGDAGERIMEEVLSQVPVPL